MGLENASRFSIALKTSAGKETEFMFSQFTDRDFSELDDWVRQKIIRTAAKSVQGLDDDIQQSTIRAAIHTAGAVNWHSQMAKDILNGQDRLAHLTWQSIQNSHNDDCTEFKLKYFDSENPNVVENCREINLALDRINALTSKSDDDENPPTDQAT